MTGQPEVDAFLREERATLGDHTALLTALVKMTETAIRAAETDRAIAAKDRVSHREEIRALADKIDRHGEQLNAVAAQLRMADSGHDARLTAEERRPHVALLDGPTGRALAYAVAMVVGAVMLEIAKHAGWVSSSVTVLMPGGAP